MVAMAREAGAFVVIRGGCSKQLWRVSECRLEVDSAPRPVWHLVRYVCPIEEKTNALSLASRLDIHRSGQEVWPAIVVGI